MWARLGRFLEIYIWSKILRLSTTERLKDQAIVDHFKNPSHPQPWAEFSLPCFFPRRFFSPRAAPPLAAQPLKTSPFNKTLFFPLEGKLSVWTCAAQKLSFKDLSSKMPFTVSSCLALRPGLPDFSRYNIPKRENVYQITTKYTK
jgi:hypothetical protein